MRMAVWRERESSYVTTLLLQYTKSHVSSALMTHGQNLYISNLVPRNLSDAFILTNWNQHCEGNWRCNIWYWRWRLQWEHATNLVIALSRKLATLKQRCVEVVEDTLLGSCQFLGLSRNSPHLTAGEVSLPFSHLSLSGVGSLPADFVKF